MSVKQISTFPMSIPLRFRHMIGFIPNLKEEFLNKQTPKQIEVAAQNWISGTIDLGDNSLDKIPYSIDDIQWDNLPITKNSNTFLLYFYGLRGIYLLTHSFKLTKKNEYIHCALKIINSHYNYIISVLPKNRMLNNDHALAERIENIVYLYACIKESSIDIQIDEEIFDFLISDAINKLFDPKIYQKNHNHGLIADKALLIGIYFIGNKDEKINFVVQRLHEQMKYGFYDDGVHKENSFDYHISMLNLLIGCQQALTEMNYKNIQLNSFINNAKKFCIYALKPNAARPLFGDSKGWVGNHPPQISSYADRQLDYILSGGKTGDKPTELSPLFPSSGYLFFRQHFEYKNFLAATWLSLRCGYTTRTHKHRDDMSLCLYSKGVDIFIDPGMYNFLYRHPMRDYMESMAAHTTIGIKDRQYSIASGNGRRFRILYKKHTDSYDYALCSSHIYKNTSIYRHLYYARDCNIIIIHDEIYSLNNNTFVQYFHLGPELSIEKNNHSYILRDKNNKCKVYMHQITPIETSRILFADETTPWSYLSTGFGSVVPTYSLEYTQSGNKVDFITCVDIRNPNEELSSFSLHKNILHISRGNKLLEIPLARKRPLFFDNAFCHIDNNKLFVTSIGINDFCCYVFDKKSNEIIKSTYINPINTLELDLKNLTNAIIIYYNKGEYGDTMYGILAEIEKVDERWIINQFSPHTPYITGYNATYDGVNIVAKVNNEYKFPSQYKWYVYKNSVSLHLEINNADTFSYKINSPGEYVVIISISDKYFGEYYFHMFDPIIIQ
ncbi:heparinase II/III family protein [Desulfovibrio piger]|uniref:heparinase II/III domain-containing protein n=1 Tax=Desulfovibrio piger TaxID=901 RepID=UPI0026F227EB|nr:heparinase II/III family protein [Desulfovibrio piger]